MSGISIETMLEKEREAKQDGLFETLAIMTYELGAVSQNLIYAGLEESKARNALHANATLEISDLVAQASILFLKIKEESPSMAFQPTWEELVEIGRERQVERMEVLKTEKRNPSLSGG